MASTHPDPFDDEADLREVIQTLLTGWRWIVGATLAGGLLAMGVTLLLPRQYEATAQVALTKPDVVYNLDPRITTQLNVPPTEGLTGLVTSRSLLSDVLKQAAAFSEVPGPLPTIDAFQEDVSASVAGTVLTLTVKEPNAGQVAILANAWAAVTVQRLNKVYAPSSGDASLYANQAKDALMQWQQAQQAVTDYQATNQEEILSDRLAALHDQLRRNLDAQDSLSMAIMDANAVKSRLQAGQGATNPGDGLASLVLALRSLSTSSAAQLASGQVVQPGASPAYQFQLDPTTLLSESPASQVAYLNTLVASMQAQRTELANSESDLESSIPDLQAQLAQAQQTRQTLETRRDLAGSAYQALANKSQESALSDGTDQGVARTALSALVPRTPIDPNVAETSVLTALGFMFLSAFSLIIADWWRETDR